MDDGETVASENLRSAYSGKITKKGNTHVSCKFGWQSRSHLFEILNALYPPKSTCSALRRKFRCTMLISEEIGRYRFSPMGTLGYIYEKERQLTQHFYMIHPHSRFWHVLRLLALIEFYISFILRVFIISQWPETFYTLGYQIPTLLADVFETSEVLLHLLVGYVDENTRTVVLEYREVVFHNLLHLRFYLNLFPSLPVDFLIYLYSLLLRRPGTEFLFFSFLKILKIFELSQYVKHFCKTYNLGGMATRVIMFCFITAHFGHWLICVHFVSIHHGVFASTHRGHEFIMNCTVDRDTKLGVFMFRHLQSLYVICTTFFGQTMFSAVIAESPSQNTVIYFFLVNIIHFFQIFFVSFFMQLMAQLKTSKILYREMTQEVQKLLAQENLPKYMHKKALQFLKFRFSERYFDENAILETLSPPLKREVKNFLCFDLVINSESIFNCLPKDMASELCLHMKLKVYMAGDTIFRAGQKSKSVYFLYNGSVVIYSSQGKELTHWYKGQQFGVAGFIDSHMYLVTALALEMSEIYVLRQEDFLKVTREHPELVARVVKAASNRIDNLLREFTLTSW